MLERFSVDGFVDAIKTHGIKRSGVQPAVFRMLLDADVPKEDLASLEFLISASGPLDPETRDEFEKHFDIPVRLAYGATEFAGSLCAWTPDARRASSAIPNATASADRCPTLKCASSTRTPEPNCPPASTDCWRRRWRRSARTGSAPPTSPRSTPTGSSPCTAGRTEPSTAAGSRSCPETVRRVLISHPGGARRLRGRACRTSGSARCRSPPSRPRRARRLRPTDELKDLVRQSLPVYNVPVAFAVVDELPRNPALKVSLPAVAALYDARATSALGPAMGSSTARFDVPDDSSVHRRRTAA